MKQENHITIEKTARYYSLGDAEEPNAVWIVIHGYAQLAGEFIDEFRPLAKTGALVIAPEGLSRFYTKGFFGNVGATWMTREDRENEINDYVNYLQKLLNTALLILPEDTPIHVLGFSQGCATVTRWLAAKEPKVQSIWMCGGETAPDVDWVRFAEYANQRDFHIAVGIDDPFIKPGDIKDVKELLKQRKLGFEFHQFEGAHEVPVQTIVDHLKAVK